MPSVFTPIWHVLASLERSCPGPSVSGPGQGGLAPLPSPKGYRFRTDWLRVIVYCMFTLHSGAIVLNANSSSSRRRPCLVYAFRSESPESGIPWAPGAAQKALRWRSMYSSESNVKPGIQCHSLSENWQNKGASTSTATSLSRAALDRFLQG